MRPCGSLSDTRAREVEGVGPHCRGFFFAADTKCAL